MSEIVVACHSDEFSVLFLKKSGCRDRVLLPFRLWKSFICGNVLPVDDEFGCSSSTVRQDEEFIDLLLVATVHMGFECSESVFTYLHSAFVDIVPDCFVECVEHAV